MISRILITRHGVSEHNLNTEMFMGRSPESRLTEEGREQARRLGMRLARQSPPKKIICSSLSRTRETGEIIGKQCGVETLELEDAFWELSKGDWEGRMPRQLSPEIQKEMESDPFGFHYGSGESYREVVERSAPVFDQYVASLAGEPVLFVLHGDVVRAVFFHIMGFPQHKINDFTVDPCSLSEFTWNKGRFHVVRLNDTAHLEG